MTDIQLQATWEEILKNLENSLSTRVCNNWLKPLKPIKLTTEMLELGAPNVFTKNWVEKYYLPFLTDSCYEITKAHLEISITNLESTKDAETIYPDELKQQQLKKRNTRVRTKKKATSLAQSNDLFQPTLTEAMQPPSEMTETPLPINPGDKSSLNPKYTFESFVIGNSNSFAHAAALAIAENPAKDYNPFFMYGGVVLGKTHLMQAVGNAILLENPNKRVLYSSSENFSNEYISSLRAGHFSNNQIQNVQNFRDKFRTLDVLLIDDIQFFERVFGQGTGSVEEEFFHTFNALQEQGKQIIMSSDRLPKEIKNLSSRLESRFISGLSVEVQQPDYETRVAILQNIANERRALIPNEVLEYIATSINSNVRELEGVINGIMARANLLRLPYTLELAQEELINKIKKQQTKITAEKIISVVSNHYSISIEDMKAKKKQKEIVQARQVAMFLLKEKLDMNLTTIGGHFGGKDHSTVISSIRKIEEAIKEEFLFNINLHTIKLISSFVTP